MYQNLKRYIPEKSLRLCNIGDIETGLDGNLWIVNSYIPKNSKYKRKKWLKIKKTESSDDEE